MQKASQPGPRYATAGQKKKQSTKYSAFGERVIIFNWRYFIRIYYPKYIVESPSSFLADPIKHLLNTYGITRLDVIIAFL